MRRAYLVCLIFLVTSALVFPFIAGRISEYFTHVMIMCYYYALLASSWNLLLGYTGQVSFAHAALSGLGSYTSALLILSTGIPPFIGILIGGIVGAVVSFVIGIISLRLRGFYFALVTIGLSESIRLIFTMEWKYTRGSLGLHVPPLLEAFSRVHYYYVMLGILCVSLFIIYKVINSHIGLFLRAIREDEDVASIMGVDTVKWKTYIFALSGFFAGVAGGFYAHYVLLIVPELMGLSEMFNIVSMVVIGGVATIIGPISGAFLVEIASEYIRASYGEYHLLIFAAVLMITLRFARGGLVELIQKQVSRLQARLKI